MKPQISYNTINGLIQLQSIKESLAQYLKIISEILGHSYPNFSIQIDFSIDDAKYVISQKEKNFIVETGFFWGVSDLYFGMKIIVPYAIDSIEKVPLDYNWSHGIEGAENSYVQLIRYSDMMVVGCASKAYIDVLRKFSDIVESSKEVIEIAKKYSVTK